VTGKEHHNFKAEASILGAIMIDDSVIDHIWDRLSVDMFWRERHRVIYRAMQELAKESRPIDLEFLFRKLITNANETQAGGMEYLAALSSFCPSVVNVDHYVDLVRSEYSVRKILSSCQTIIDRAGAVEGSTDSLQEFVADGIGDLSAVLEDAEESAAKHTGLFDGAFVLQRFEEQMDSGVESCSTMKTGFTSFDKDAEIPIGLSVWGARPGTGKSTLAGTLADNFIAMGEVPLIVSLEDPPANFEMRSLARMTNIPTRSVRFHIENRPNHPDSAFDRDLLREAITTRKKAAPRYDFCPGKSIDEIRMRIRREVHQNGITVVMIDHALKIKRNSRREVRDEVSDICNKCHELGMQLGIPILLFTQLRRANPKAKDLRPTMESLKETGTFEESARLVVLLHREEYASAEGRRKRNDEWHPMELITDKGNDAATGTSYLMFRGPTHSIREPDMHELSAIISKQQAATEAPEPAPYNPF